MSKPQSNKAENNIDLVAGGLIGLGCLTALGVGLITLPVAIGVGTVVAIGFGANELMKIREDETPQQIKKKHETLNESQIKEKKASEEGKRIATEIANEHMANPNITTENSSIIKKYQNLYEEEKNKNANSQEAKDAKFKFRVAYVTKEIAIDFYENKTISNILLEEYKSDPEFSLKTIAQSAFNEVARVITEFKRPSYAPKSPTVNWKETAIKII